MEGDVGRIAGLVAPRGSELMEEVPVVPRPGPRGRSGRRRGAHQSAGASCRCRIRPSSHLYTTWMPSSAVLADHRLVRTAQANGYRLRQQTLVRHKAPGSAAEDQAPWSARRGMAAWHRGERSSPWIATRLPAPRAGAHEGLAQKNMALWMTAKPGRHLLGGRRNRCPGGRQDAGPGGPAR